MRPAAARSTVLLMAAIALTCTLGASEIVPPEPTSRPGWCRDGFVCLTTADSALLYDELERLQGEVSRLERLGRRWGGTWGGQGGVSPWDGTPYAGVGYCWGWRTSRY